MLTISICLPPGTFQNLRHTFSTWIIRFRCCGGARAKITNCGSFLFITDLKKFYRQKSWSLKKFLCKVNCYNYKTIMVVKSKKSISKISSKTILNWSQSFNSKEIISAPQHWYLLLLPIWICTPIVPILLCTGDPYYVLYTALLIS